MKLLIATWMLASLLGCGEEEKKKSSGDDSLNVDPGQLKFWTLSETTLNSTKQGKTVRELGANGKPVKVEIFNANDTVISTTVFEYNDSGLATKSTLTSGENVTVSDRTYDESGRITAQTITLNNRVLSEVAYDYSSNKISKTIYDATNDNKTVIELAEENYAFSSANTSGLDSFQILVGGFTKSPDESAYIEFTSDCSAAAAAGDCTLTYTNKITAKKSSEVTSSNNIKKWNVAGREVIRNNISRQVSKQFDDNGSVTAEYEAKFTYNSKYLPSESITKFTFPTDLQTDYTEYLIYTYDDTGLNITETKSRKESDPDEENGFVTESITTFTY